MIKLIDHIGIVVRSIDKSLKTYTEALGLNLMQIEDNEAFGVKIAFLPVGDTLVELIEPTTSEGTMASEFLKEKGEGLHHIAFQVDGLAGLLNRMKEQGVPLIHETPQPGGLGSLVAFMHPSGANNVHIELIEKGEG
jgi:methylmalonyl-CoA/ethylmalonyl-CoA epimerase